MKSIWHQRDEDGALGNGCEPYWNMVGRSRKEILEEARVEPIATVMRRRRLELSGHVKRRDETENTTAVVEFKMEGKT